MHSLKKYYFLCYQKMSFFLNKQPHISVFVVNERGLGRRDEANSFIWWTMLLLYKTIRLKKGNAERRCEKL